MMVYKGLRFPWRIPNTACVREAKSTWTFQVSYTHRVQAHRATNWTKRVTLTKVGRPACPALSSTSVTGSTA